MFQDYVYQNKEKENREAELTIINKELAFQNHEKEKRIFALITANSELKKAEKELAEKEFFLRESQKIGKIGSYELNFITGFWKSSEMLDSIFGINQNYDRSILGWIEIIHPHDQQKMDEYLRMEVIVKQKSFNKEYRIIRINDRQTRWVHGRGELKFDTTGNITEMIGTIQDITERKKTEENLKQSENRFRSFYEKACDPILIIDESFHFTDCNNAAIAILGATSKDQIINKPPVFFSPEYQPDGQLSAVKAEQMIKNAYKEGSHQFEWIHKRIDGFAIYIDVRLTVIPMENKNVLLVYWRDITESKKAEATIRKLYQAIEHTNEIVFMTDIDGTLNFVNTAFEEVYGYKKEEVVGKTTPRILKSGIMEKQFYEELWKKLPSGKGLSKEIVNKTKDGRLINIHTSLTPIFDDRKILIGYMAVQEDITEKKIAEKKLLNAELKYRTLFEQSSDGISVVDPETLLPIDFNEKMHTQLGYSREEFAQLKISDYEMIFSPEIIKEREIKIKLHGHANFETTHKKKNGDILHVQVDIISIILHGKPQFYATYRDITEKIKLERERKQHEIDQQRQIVEATISGQEAEKKDLSLELHDNIVQILVTVKIYLGILICISSWLYTFFFRGSGGVEEIFPFSSI